VDKAAGRQALLRVSEVLSGERWVLLTNRILATAVPLVKVVVNLHRAEERHPPVHLDISVVTGQNHHGLRSLHMIHALQEQTPQLGPITLVLKQYLCSKELSDAYTGGLGSHALTLLVAAFLQSRGSEVGLVGSTLLDMLEYFANEFDAKIHMAQPSLATTNNAKASPPLCSLREMSPEEASQGAPLTVLDPVLGSNVARSTFRFSAVQRAFGDAHCELRRHYMPDGSNESPAPQGSSDAEAPGTQPSSGGGLIPLITWK